MKYNLHVLKLLLIEVKLIFSLLLQYLNVLYVTWYNESTCLLFCFDGLALTLYVLTPCRNIIYMF
jgi:hypothetical protein